MLHAFVQRLKMPTNSLFIATVDRRRQLSWQPGLTTVTPSLQDFLRRQSIHFNESRTQLLDLLLELGHEITSLPFSEACTGFRSNCAYNRNCAWLCTWCASVAVLPTWMAWWQPPPIYTDVRDFDPPTVSDTKPHKWNSSLASGVSNTKGIELSFIQSPGTYKHWYFFKQLKTHLFELAYEWWILTLLMHHWSLQV